MKAILQTPHTDRWLEEGWLLALRFAEGFVCVRVESRGWANLEPYVLTRSLSAGAQSSWDEVMSDSYRYLNPHSQQLIYQTFWGVTPYGANIYVDFPPRKQLGSMLSTPRTETGDVGYIDSKDSPFEGPFSPVTETFTVQGVYPQYRAYNKLSDPIDSVKMNFDQMQYTYNLVTDKDLIKDMLVGPRRVKKNTVGPAWTEPARIPDWLSKLVGSDMLKYTLDVLKGRA